MYVVCQSIPLYEEGSILKMEIFSTIPRCFGVEIHGINLGAERMPLHHRVQEFVAPPPNISHFCFLAGNAEIWVPWNGLNNTLNPGKVFQVHIAGSTT